jgi:acylphosphatase
MTHYSIHVTGKVQGVFFRASAKEKAEEFRLSGFVHNNVDGSVSIEAEGEAQNLKQFLEWCMKGPPLSRVQRCEFTEGSVQDFKGFFIK